MTNEQIALRIKAGENTADNMLVLYENMRGAIYKLARRYSGYAELEDLTQEGYLALCRAVELYEPGDCSFFSYAYKCIMSHMLRYIQNNSNFPAHMWERVRKYNRLCDAFKKEFNRKPIIAEISYYLGINDQQSREVVKMAYAENNASLESPVVSGDEEIALGDTLKAQEDVENSVIDNLHDEHLKEQLWLIVDSLEGKQPEVIRGRYQEQKTRQEIADTMNVEYYRIRDIEEKALRTLRTSKRRELVPLLDDATIAVAYRNVGSGTFNRTWTSSTENAVLKMLKK